MLLYCCSTQARAASPCPFSTKTGHSATPSFQAGRLENGVGVRQPDLIILLETRENAPQGGSPVGRPDHKGMDSNDHRRRLARGVGAGLASELQHVIEPQRLGGRLHPREVLAHVERDNWIG